MTREHAVATLLSSPAGIAPLHVWIAIKVVLRRELGEREYEMWIQHARLWRVMSGDTLGVLVPRNGKASFGVLRHVKRVRRLARKMAYGVMISVAPDMELHQLKREAIEAMPVSDLGIDELREYRQEMIDRDKVPEQFREQGFTVAELLRVWPVSHVYKAELIEKWETQNEWLSEPFLEPPCSGMWKERNAS